MKPLSKTFLKPQHKTPEPDERQAPVPAVGPDLGVEAEAEQRPVDSMAFVYHMAWSAPLNGIRPQADLNAQQFGYPQPPALPLTQPPPLPSEQPPPLPLQPPPLLSEQSPPLSLQPPPLPLALPPLLAAESQRQVPPAGAVRMPPVDQSMENTIAWAVVNGPDDEQPALLNGLFRAAADPALAGDAQEMLTRLYGNPQIFSVDGMVKNRIRATIREEALKFFQENGDDAPACIIYLAGRAGQVRGGSEGQHDMNLAHVAMDRKLRAHGIRLNDDRCLVNRARTLADDEFQYVGRDFSNLSCKSAIDASLDTEIFADVYGEMLLVHGEEVIRTGRPALIPINTGGHWLTLFLVKEAGLCKAVLFDSLPRPADAVPAPLRVVLEPLLDGTVDVQAGNLQAHTPNSCGVQFQLVGSIVDRFLDDRQALQGGHQEPVGAADIVDLVELHIADWQSLSPADQVAQVDEANMERFQAMTLPRR